jgi:FkbM family methyltransferase
MRIGSYGPFKLDGRFAYADYEHWGEHTHNAGFEACIEACRGRDCVLDVGGHIGLVTLPAASVLGNHGKVIAFEPASANNRLLKYHIEINGLENVQVCDQLVGANEISEVDFYEQDTDSGLNSIAQMSDDGRFTKSTRTQTTLDAFCATHGLAPDVIKIDVEGAEIGVLRGAYEIIRASQPLIFLSVHPKHIGQLGGSTTEILQILDELGYDCRDSNGHPAAVLDFSEYLLTPKESH